MAMIDPEKLSLLGQTPPMRYDGGRWALPRRISSDEDDIDRSGTSVRSRTSDPMTYDTMMQLSIPRNPFRHESFRSFMIWSIASIILFLTNQLTTLPVGFFPAYAKENLYMSSMELSVFFSVYPLSIMLSSPLAAYISPCIGRQTVICVGLLLSGSSTMAFAYCGSAAAVFSLRVLQGLGAGAAVVGTFSLITEEFSANVGQVLLVQELIVAAAFITAPPLGSVLYDYQGFQIPFLVSGVAQLLVMMVTPILFIEYALSDGLYTRTHVPVTLYLSTVTARVKFQDALTPTCVTCLVLTVFSMMSFGFIDPYLGTHLEIVLGAQHFAVGLGFGLSAFVYFLGGLMYVWLSGKVGSKQVIVFGLFLLSLGFFFLGPPPFLNMFFQDYNRLWSTQYLSLVFIGCGGALSIAPGLPLTLMSVANSGAQAHNLVVGLFTAAIYLGQALGPFLALLLMQIVPTTHSLNCFASVENSFMACDSPLPWTFTAYSFVTVALMVYVMYNLSTGEAIVELLQRNNSKRVSFVRQPSDYGQFVFLDEEDFEDKI